MLAKRVRTDEERRIDENLQRFRLAGRMAVARFLELGEGEILRKTKEDPTYIAPHTVEAAAELIRETQIALPAEELKAIEAVKESIS